MKFALFLAALAVCSYSVLANGDSHSSDSNSEDDDGFGCSCGRNANDNPCTRTNLTTLGCPFSNKYVTCAGTTCTPQTCPAGQIWNATQNQCAACQTGFQVSANNQTCVCNQGTTSTGPNACGPCPTDATVTQYYCYCSSPQILNTAANGCQACPTGATPAGVNTCICSGGLFWNAGQWACQPCPGNLVNVTLGRRTVQQCQCTSPDVFNHQTVSCVPCPSGTSPDSDDDACDCPINGQYYNTTTSACQCPWNTVLNAAGSGCQWSPSPAATGRRRRHV